MVTHSRQAATADLRLYRAISDPTRRAILDRLRRGEASAGELAGAFPVSRPAISRHLRLLRQGKLVREYKDGRNRIYALNPQPLQRIDEWLSRYRLFWAARLHDLKTFVESRHASGETKASFSTPRRDRDRKRGSS